MSAGSLVETQHNISHHHHALTPHQKLPCELLAEIFVQCMPSVEFEDVRYYMSHGWSVYPHHIRARLALVCRAWYTVLYNEPRVWTTIVFLGRFLVHPESVSLWIKKSKSAPLVIFIPHCRMDLGPDSSLSMLRKEMWRIRCFFWNIYLETDLSVLFPLDVSTNAPMLQSFALFSPYMSGFNQDTVKLGDIHCPELRTLLLSRVKSDIKSLTVGPLKNVQHLIVDRRFPDLHDVNLALTYLRLLEALPNLVSLSLNLSGYGTPLPVVFPRVVLQPLKSLTLELCCGRTMTSMLESLHVTSLERLVLGVTTSHDFTESMEAFCDNLFQLRHLTLRNIGIGRRVHVLLDHLEHLESLTIDKLYDVDELLIALSSHNPGSSIRCPYLNTIDISFSLNLKPDVLVDFVQQRVKSDLDDPAPGLVTCLKLSEQIRSNEKLYAQLVKTHSSSIIFSGSHATNAEIIL